jgi:ABC-type lipoprotein release transport system permease subunit
LFGVQLYDPTTLAGAALVPIEIAFIAAYLPAARASRIDPISAS